MNNEFDFIVVGSGATGAMAAQTLAKFCDLTLKQQLLDLRTRQLEGKPEAVSLSDLVSAAEARAEKRIRERDDEDGQRSAGT